jgi:hypothetical protein
LHVSSGASPGALGAHKQVLALVVSKVLRKAQPEGEHQNGRGLGAGADFWRRLLGSESHDDYFISQSGDHMKTLVLVVFLSWAASANAQSGAIVYMCLGPRTVCAQKLGTDGGTVSAVGSDHTNPEHAAASALPQESQVLLADNFRWEAPRPLAKVAQIPVMIARSGKAKAGSHWGKPVE